MGTLKGILETKEGPYLPAHIIAILEKEERRGVVEVESGVRWGQRAKNDRDWGDSEEGAFEG